MTLLFFFMSEGDSKNILQGSGGALLAAGSTAATPYFPRKRKGHESPHDLPETEDLLFFPLQFVMNWSTILLVQITEGIIHENCSSIF